MKSKDIFTFVLFLLALACVISLLNGCKVESGILQSPTPAPSAIPDPSPAASPISGDLSSIISLASHSACATHDWANRGTIPRGAVKGLALVYARSVCHPERSDVQVVANTSRGSGDKDVMTHYGLSSDDPLLHVYALMFGLAMRESSGQYCCGRDMSANFSSANSAEAGIFQTSWGVSIASTELPKLFAKYSASESGCLLDVFKEGVSCSQENLKNWGSGTGFDWQALTKRCPAFAAEYAAVVLRTSGGAGGEFGPIRHKAAELRPECESMLSSVKSLVKQNPAICALL